MSLFFLWKYLEEDHSNYSTYVKIGDFREGVHLNA